MGCTSVVSTTAGASRESFGRSTELGQKGVIGLEGREVELKNSEELLEEESMIQRFRNENELRRTECLGVSSPNRH